MKPAILILSYFRHDLTARTLRHNLHRTGCDVGLFVSDMQGIAKASNTMLRRAIECGYDFFVICGNDILENNDWVKRRMDFINSTKDCGMVSVPIDKKVKHPSAEMVIGNFMISKKTVDLVGAFDERYDPYGSIDLDYNKRCNKAGLINYYLPNDQAEHIHCHTGEDLYGYSKEKMVKKTWALHSKDIENYHIPL